MKYRIVKREDKYYIQNKSFLGRWLNIGRYYYAPEITTWGPLIFYNENEAINYYNSHFNKKYNNKVKPKIEPIIQIIRYLE